MLLSHRRRSPGYGGILGQVIVACHQSLATSAEDWRKAPDKVVPAVIVLWTNVCQAFNTEAAGASYAMGFVDFLYGAYKIPAYKKEEAKRKEEPR